MSRLKSLWSHFDDRVWYRFLVWIYLKKKKVCKTLQDKNFIRKEKMKAGMYAKTIDRCTCGLYCLCMCTNVYEEIPY